MSPPPQGLDLRATPPWREPLTCSFAIGCRVTHRVYRRNLSTAYHECRTQPYARERAPHRQHAGRSRRVALEGVAVPYAAIGAPWRPPYSSLHESGSHRLFDGVPPTALRSWDFAATLAPWAGGVTGQPGRPSTFPVRRRSLAAPYGQSPRRERSRPPRTARRRPRSPRTGHTSHSDR